jgi:hypothetical protein
MCHGAKRSVIFLVPSVVQVIASSFTVAISFVMLFLFSSWRCFRLGLVLRNIELLFFWGSACFGNFGWCFARKSVIAHCSRFSQSEVSHN